jgi:hypothetical protein
VGLGAETRRVPCPDRESVWADRGPRQKRRLKVVPLMTDPETITLRFTLIDGQRDELASRGSSSRSSNGHFQPRCDPKERGAAGGRSRGGHDNFGNRLAVRIDQHYAVGQFDEK